MFNIEKFNRIFISKEKNGCQTIILFRCDAIIDDTELIYTAFKIEKKITPDYMLNLECDSLSNQTEEDFLYERCTKSDFFTELDKSVEPTFWLIYNSIDNFNKTKEVAHLFFNVLNGKND